MKKLMIIFSLSVLGLTNVYCQNEASNYLYRCNEKLIDVIMEDIFTPPVASRVHVYPNIAAYEVLCKKNKSLTTLCTQLKELDSISDPVGKVDYSLSACLAFTTVAKKLVYSEYLFKDFETVEIKNWLLLNNNDTLLLHNSVDYGKAVAQQIIAWIKKDHYSYTRTLMRYVLNDSLGAWRPTSPDYANALEPNWPLMRSFVFDSTNKIMPKPNLAYSENKKSEYYKNAMAVYKQSMELDSTKKEIASFWDCNPNITKYNGHLTYFVHKVSPGGHWLRIAGQACKNLQLDEYKTAEVYTMVTIGIYEAFLNCWSCKYVCNAVRPETYINRLIAPKWRPLIETPPFPEYTSGHSTVSSTSATILTALIPQPYAYTDSSEMYINLPPRHFNNFKEAAAEASISRFYGGIHYMPALNNGLEHGAAIGTYLLKKIIITQP